MKGPPTKHLVRIPKKPARSMYARLIYPAHAICGAKHTANNCIPDNCYPECLNGIYMVVCQKCVNLRALADLAEVEL